MSESSFLIKLGANISPELVFLPRFMLQKHVICSCVYTECRQDACLPGEIADRSLQGGVSVRRDNELAKHIY